MNTRVSSLRGLAAMLLAAAFTSAIAQEARLYRAGPAVDASFLRFIDGTGGGVAATSPAGTVTLTAQRPSTAFFPVQSKWRVKGQLAKDGKQVPLDLQAQPGEFISVVALPGPDGLASQILREQPDDFNALKASLGFANLAGQACAPAELKVAGRTVSLFDKVPALALQRRLLNPVKLSVQLNCSGKPMGAALALGRLEAGERYSVLVVPDAAGARLLFAHDALSQ